MVVKVDAKTKVILDNYKGLYSLLSLIQKLNFKNQHSFLFSSAEKIKSSGAGPVNGDDEFLTQEQRVQDKWVKERIGSTVKDYESEMQANQARGK